MSQTSSQASYVDAIEQVVGWVQEAKARATKEGDDPRALLKEALAQDIMKEIQSQRRTRKTGASDAAQRLYRDARRRAKTEAERPPSPVDAESEKEKHDREETHLANEALLDHLREKKEHEVHSLNLKMGIDDTKKKKTAIQQYQANLANASEAPHKTLAHAIDAVLLTLRAKPEPEPEEDSEEEEHPMANKSYHELLYQEGMLVLEERERWREEGRTVLAARDAQACTFEPRLNTNSRAIMRAHEGRERLDRRAGEIQDELRMKKQHLMNITQREEQKKCPLKPTINRDYERAGPKQDIVESLERRQMDKLERQSKLTSEREREARQQETFTPNLGKPRGSRSAAAWHAGAGAGATPARTPGHAPGNGREGSIHERLYALSAQRRVDSAVRGDAAATATAAAQAAAASTASLAGSSSAAGVRPAARKLSVEAQENLVDQLYRDAAVRAWRQHEAEADAEEEAKRIAEQPKMSARSARLAQGREERQMAQHFEGLGAMRSGLTLTQLHALLQRVGLLRPPPPDGGGAAAATTGTPSRRLASPGRRTTAFSSSLVDDGTDDAPAPSPARRSAAAKPAAEAPAEPAAPGGGGGLSILTPGEAGVPAQIDAEAELAADTEAEAALVQLLWRQLATPGPGPSGDRISFRSFYNFMTSEDAPLPLPLPPGVAPDAAALRKQSLSAKPIGHVRDPDARALAAERARDGPAQRLSFSPTLSARLTPKSPRNELLGGRTVFDALYSRAAHHHMRAEARRIQHGEKQMETCTFSPTINKKYATRWERVEALSSRQ